MIANMITTITQPWIDVGYHLFAKEGPKGLKVEVIARKVGKSKSSFYNYFGDWEVFEELLLEHHLKASKAFADEAEKLKNVNPDLVILFNTNKTNVFFHKQLRVHREKLPYRNCFEAVYQFFEKAILKQWTAFLQLENRPFLAAKTLQVLSENFFLQITYNTYNQHWLQNYLMEISKLFIDLNADKKE